MSLVQLLIPPRLGPLRVSQHCSLQRTVRRATRRSSAEPDSMRGERAPAPCLHYASIGRCVATPCVAPLAAPCGDRIARVFPRVEKHEGQQVVLPVEAWPPRGRDPVADLGPHMRWKNRGGCRKICQFTGVNSYVLDNFHAPQYCLGEVGGLLPHLNPPLDWPRQQTDWRSRDSRL